MNISENIAKQMPPNSLRTGRVNRAGSWPCTVGNYHLLSRMIRSISKTLHPSMVCECEKPPAFRGKLEDIIVDGYNCRFM